MSRRGICHIWFRGRHISPSMPYREARSVAESSEGPTASKSDRTGRNPGMTRLVRRSSAGVWRYCVFLFFFYVSAKLRNALADFIPTYEFTGFKRESRAAFCTAALLFNKYIFKYYVFMFGFMKTVLKTAGTKNSRHVFRKSVR